MISSRLNRCFWSYLSWHGIFTQDSFIVFGKNWGIVIYVQHCDESDAFTNLSRILWKKKKQKRLFSSQV